jgi:arylformamidase
MTWLDISVPIRDGMPTFTGDPTVHLERAQSMSDGAICNVSRLDFGVHSGTHIDAPVHFIDGAGGVEDAGFDLLVGPAEVVDARDIDGAFDAAAIDRMAIPAGTTRLIFLSRNSDLWSLPGFSTTFAGVTLDGARALIERGVRLVGADYLSIAPFDSPVATHVALLKAGVIVVEGLDLRGVEPGSYDLIVLPLRIPGCDGGPARAILQLRQG